MYLKALSIHRTRFVFQHLAKGIQFKGSHICSAQLKPGDQSKEDSPRPFFALLPHLSKPMLWWLVPTAHITEKL